MPVETSRSNGAPHAIVARLEAQEIMSYMPSHDTAGTGYAVDPGWLVLVNVLVIRGGFFNPKARTLNTHS